MNAVLIYIAIQLRLLFALTLCLVAIPLFGKEPQPLPTTDVPPTLPKDVAEIANGTKAGALNKPAGTDITATSAATVTGGTVSPVVQSGTALYGNPMDPGLRQQFMQSTNNALMANQLLGKAAASGEYNTEKLEVQRAFWAMQMSQGLQNPAQQSAPTSSKKQKNASQRANGTSRSDSSATSSSGSAPQSQVFAPVVEVNVSLKFSDPSVVPQAAANQVLSDIKTAIPTLSLADVQGGGMSPGAQFVMTLVETIREVGAKSKEAEKAATGDEYLSKDDKAVGDTVRLDENAQTSGKISTSVNEASSALTDEQKEDLQKFVKSALAVTAAKAKKELGPNDSRDTEEFRAASKNALGDETVADALAKDIASAVADFVAKDRESHEVLSSRSAKRDLKRKLSDWNDAGKRHQEIDRSLASTKEASAEFSKELSDPKNLILLALVTLLGMLGLSGRRRQN